jgi:hypothetical protein
MRKALQLFAFVPAESHFNRRRHRRMPLLHALAPPRRAAWEALQTCTADALDTFPMPVCENICANRRRLEKAFRGYRASHRDYFHGVKVHLWVASGGFIAAFWLTPGSWHDLLLLRRVHAVTLNGFMLKLMCFIYAHNFNLLHKVVI